MRFIGTIGCLSLVLLAGGVSYAETPLAAAPEAVFTFKADSGEEVEAFRGELFVPENRSDPNSRNIPLRYVRFAATGKHPGAPIIYLAGGPGGSGVAAAKWRRFPLFMAMREFGDVIALEQRGAGLSDDTPKCISATIIPNDEVLSEAAALSLLRQSVVQCRAFWEKQGVDLRGYTTIESAYDLDDLRVHLGAEKITLWGISYGSHLALAALKEMGGRIDRVVIASAEGLDQTVKLPSRTDAYFDRLQVAIDAQPEAKAAYPDVKALMRRVHAKLEANPVMLHLEGADGENADYLLQKYIMQMMASALISDPERAAMLLQLYVAADAGFYDPIAGVVQQYFLEPQPQLSWRAMPLAMDLASGISDERLALVQHEAKDALIGDLLNFPMPHLRGVFEDIELGDGFREAPVSNVPTLLLTGTLDGRTYPESQQEAVSGLANVTTVTVQNAGHNLFMNSPEVTQVIQRFMRREEVNDTTIELPLPKFIH
jgi:pimeloyl-ACP methyl ester carboxylesterase